MVLKSVIRPFSPEIFLDFYLHERQRRERVCHFLAVSQLSHARKFELVLQRQHLQVVGGSVTGLSCVFVFVCLFNRDHHLFFQQQCAQEMHQ